MSENMLLPMLTTIMGVSVMLLTLYLGTRFWRLGKPISRAFAYNLAGECTAAAVTTMFSVIHLLGLLPAVGLGAATAMRITAFAAMMASSIHMAVLITRLESHED